MITIWFIFFTKLVLVLLLSFAETTNSYVYVTIARIWLDAQAHCRAYYTDLVTIESSVENTKVFQKKNRLWVECGLVFIENHGLGLITATAYLETGYLENQITLTLTTFVCVNILNINGPMMIALLRKLSFARKVTVPFSKETLSSFLF